MSKLFGRQRLIIFNVYITVKLIQGGIDRFLYQNVAPGIFVRHQKNHQAVLAFNFMLGIDCFRKISGYGASLHHQIGTLLFLVKSQRCLTISKGGLYPVLLVCQILFFLFHDVKYSVDADTDKHACTFILMNTHTTQSIRASPKDSVIDLTLCPKYVQSMVYY